MAETTGTKTTKETIDDYVAEFGMDDVIAILSRLRHDSPRRCGDCVYFYEEDDGKGTCEPPNSPVSDGMVCDAERDWCTCGVSLESCRP